LKSSVSQLSCGWKNTAAISGKFFPLNSQERKKNCHKVLFSFQIDVKATFFYYKGIILFHQDTYKREQRKYQ